MATRTGRYAVIGGGIVGLGVARALTLSGATVTVFEKEPALALHQTGHNSGVVHAGLTYEPGSLKAQLCRRGAVMLKEYAEANSVPYDECGKVVVARTEPEVDRLGAILTRAQANGVPGVRLLDRSELRAIEPNVSGLAALHSPVSAITDYAALTEQMATDVRAGGGTVRLSAAVTGVDAGPNEVVVRTADGDATTFDYVIACAGLQADRVGEMVGGSGEPRIVPFRGEYFALTGESKQLVNGLVYPVADPRYPFLGVHVTPRVDGEVLIGPNAVLSLAREGYGWRNISFAELGGMAGYRGFRAFAREHWRTGITEVVRSVSKRRFLADARTLLPDIGTGDVRRAASGVRAQALGLDGAMVDDFRLEGGQRTLSIRNAPSPAATSSLAIADHVLDHLPW